MILENLFPTTVGMFDLERELTIEELNFINGLEKEKNAGNFISKDRYILRDRSLKSLNDFFSESISKYFSSTVNPQDENVSIEITQSWINYNEPEHYHHKHSHPNSYFSGVFYVKADSENDKIYFYKEDFQKMLYFYPKSFNLHNSDTWWLPASTGKLILFPSWLQHSVEAFDAKDSRISLSFNTFPRGTFGDMKNLTELSIV